MFTDLIKNLLWLIGGNDLDPTFSVWQLIVRTGVVFVAAFLLIRIGKRRFMGRFTAFDVLMGFLVGSIMSRAITGAIRLIDMIIIIASLMAMHWVFSTLTYYFTHLSGLVKTSSRKLIVNGEVQEDAMRKSKLGENDLLQAVRTKANLESFDHVETAYLERDGVITVIPKVREPRVLEITVQDGVQTVKISLE